VTRYQAELIRLIAAMSLGTGALVMIGGTTVHNSPGVSRGSCPPGMTRADTHSCAHGYPRPSDVEVAQLTDSREAGAPADNEWG